jgi:methionine sulfoxide reductase heme-binding subunit
MDLKRLFVHLLLSLSLLLLAGSFFIIEWEDPVKKISDWSGLSALYLLILLIALRPIKQLTKLHLLKYRRAVGLWSFFYVFIHALNYTLFDHEFNVVALFNEAFEKPYLFFGFVAFFVLLYMSITSTPKLFKKLHKTHLLLYPTFGLIFAHYMMSQKVISLEIWAVFGLVVVLIGWRVKRGFYRCNAPE